METKIPTTGVRTDLTQNGVQQKDSKISFNLQYLRTVFSFPVWDTQMQWSVLASEYLRKVLVTTAEASAKPNSEWSVNTVDRPSIAPMNNACGIIEI